jgi:uncharacterized membrane protein
MIRCSTCNATLNDGTAFCAFCGAPQTGASSPGGAAPQASAPGPESSGMSPNVAGALAYPLGFITGILFLKIDPYKYDPFVRFHAFQSIFLSLFYGLLIVAWDAFAGLVFDARLGFLWGLILPLYSLLRVAMVLLGFFLMYKAFNGQRFSLAFIGPLAAKRAG